MLHKSLTNGERIQQNKKKNKRQQYQKTPSVLEIGRKKRAFFFKGPGLNNQIYTLYELNQNKMKWEVKLVKLIWVMLWNFMLFILNIFFIFNRRSVDEFLYDKIVVFF